MASDQDGDRKDLGALLQRLLAVVLERETELLRAREVTMWEYVVLGGLEHGPAQTQNQLASAVHRDKTRLIPILDHLQDRGLVERQPDPRDRRNRVVSLTARGREVLAGCRRDIRRMEADLLSALDAGEADTTVRALVRLVDITPPASGNAT